MTSIRVAVAWASATAQEVVCVTLPAGATVADAIAASDAFARAGIDARLAGYAIYGQAARSDTPLRDGDRVEITRPLVADPKDLRRSRARDRPLPPARPVRHVRNRS